MTGARRHKKDQETATDRRYAPRRVRLGRTIRRPSDEREKGCHTRCSPDGGGVGDPGNVRVRHGKWMDVNMLAMTTGRGRTAKFRELFGRAGFALEHIVPTGSPLSIIVGKPIV